MGKKLIKIGQLAKQVGVLPSTINFYTREGLLPEADRSQGGYRMYEEDEAIRVIKQIQTWQQSKRLTIAEIKAKLKAGK